MLATLFPLLRAAAAAEIARAFAPQAAAPPDLPVPAAKGQSPASPPPSGAAATVPNAATLPATDPGLTGLAAPSPLSPRLSGLSDPVSPKPGLALSPPPLSGEDRPDAAERPARPATTAPVPATAAPPDPGPAAPSHLKAAFPAALDEAMSYGAFPFTLGGTGASAAALVIFNAAMSPSWPPALRLDPQSPESQPIRLAGTQLAQMTPQETAEFLARMAALFGFLLLVKKRLSRSLQEEKESILGLFALFGVAMDTLVKGMQLAFDLTAEQRALLERVAVETEGQPAGLGGRRHRLKL